MVCSALRDVALVRFITPTVSRFLKFCQLLPGNACPDWGLSRCLRLHTDRLVWHHVVRSGRAMAPMWLAPASRGRVGTSQGGAMDRLVIAVALPIAVLGPAMFAQSPQPESATEIGRLGYFEGQWKVETESR